MECHENIPSVEEIKNMKRKDLVAHCKAAGLKANGTNALLMESLLETFQQHSQMSETSQESPLETSPIQKIFDGEVKREYRPFDSFSKLFAQRTPMKQAIAKRPLTIEKKQIKSLVSPLKQHQNSGDTVEQYTQTTDSSVASISTQTEEQPKKVEQMDELFDKILEALDDPSVNISQQHLFDVDEHHDVITARCVVTGLKSTHAADKWGKLVLSDGRINLLYKNTSRPFLFTTDELADPDETEPSNFVSPPALNEHDQRWLQKEISNMRISSRGSSPQNIAVSSPSKLRTPVKVERAQGNIYHRQALERSALKSGKMLTPLKYDSKENFSIQ